MKTFNFLILISMVFAAVALAQNYYSNTDDLMKARQVQNANTTQVGEVSAGMETLEVTPGYSAIVPKGTKLLKSGDQVLPERIAQYSARRFDEMDQRFKSIEDDVLSLKGEIEQLKASIKELQQRIRQ